MFRETVVFLLPICDVGRVTCDEEMRGDVVETVCTPSLP